MVSPGTDIVKNHECLSITNEFQLKKKTGIPKLKIRGPLQCMSTGINWRQTPKLFIAVL